MNQIATLRPALEKLVDHALGVSFDQLPEQTARMVEARLADIVGCAIGGARADGCANLLDLFTRQGGAAQSRVIGTDIRLPAVNAAMVNAIFARSFDYEVMTVRYHDELIPSHHAATTITCALAAADMVGASAKQLIAAIAVGDDLSARLLIASGLDFSQGWDGSSVYSAPGAALAASKLLGLDRQTTIHAIGLAVAQISHTIQDLYDGSSGFKLAQGTAARNAMTAVELAAAGWTGMIDPLGSRFGFFNQYTAGCARPHVLTEDIGKSYFAEEHFKKYPSCMATHLGIEAALQAHAMQEIDPAEVSGVTIRMPRARMGNFCNKPFEPRDFPHCDAIFSYAFPVANAVMKGSVVPSDYLRGQEGWAHTKALTDRTTVEAAEDGRQGVEVEVSLRCGTTVKAYADTLTADPRSGAYDPVRARQKFLQQVEGAGWPSDEAETAFDMLSNFRDSAMVGNVRLSFRQGSPS